MPGRARVFTRVLFTDQEKVEFHIQFEQVIVVGSRKDLDVAGQAHLFQTLLWMKNIK